MDPLISVVGPGVATANLIRSLINDAKAAGRTDVQALLTYCNAIEVGVTALLNETRNLLAAAVVDVEDDDAARELRKQIHHYFAVHEIYEPLRVALLEAEDAYQRLNRRAERFLGLTDMRNARRRALDRFAEDFVDMVVFQQRLEGAMAYLPNGTGLAAPILLQIVAILELSEDERMARKDDVLHLAAEGLAEVNGSDLAGLTEKLVRSRQALVRAFGVM